jgi:hypothetical protein
MAEVDAEFELSSGSSKFGEDECSEWTTISKTGIKSKLYKIGVEETCINDNEHAYKALRLIPFSLPSQN